MKSSTYALISSLILTSALLGACSMSTATPAFIPPANVPNLVPQVPVANNIVDMYASPMVAPPGVARTIRLWAFTQQVWQGDTTGRTGISSIGVSYQGTRIGTINLDPNQASTHGSIEWTPPSAPGDYTLQADVPGQVIQNGYSIERATVCVDNLGLTVDQFIVPGEQVCSLLPSPETTAPFHITGTSASIQAGCNISRLEFNINVDDPASQVYYAYADLANVSSESGDHSFGTPRPGPSTFTLVMNWSTADLARQLGTTGSITWTAGAVAHSGQLVIDGPHQLAVTLPDCPIFPTLPGPLFPGAPNLVPTMQLPLPLNAIQTNTPTATSAPAAVVCPSGTYFAPASNSCIKVYFSPTPKPTKKAPSCKKYTDASACTSNGCSWDKGTNTCS
jgi:hypothetical protein